MQHFRDRIDAGRQLADIIKETAIDLSGGIVLGIPRGGVVVAAEVAQALNLPLNVLVTKKVGAPDNPEYAIGAIGPDGQAVLNEEANLIDRDTLDRAVEEARLKVTDLRRLLGTHFEATTLTGRPVILVDDGIATGWTMDIAAQWLRIHEPSTVVIASPIISPDAHLRLRKVVDEIITVNEPPDFGAIGEFYDQFLPVDEMKVAALVEQFRAPHA